jgi:hypothetical protein
MDSSLYGLHAHTQWYTRITHHTPHHVHQSVFLFFLPHSVEAHPLLSNGLQCHFLEEPSKGSRTSTYGAWHP